MMFGSLAVCVLFVSLCKATPTSHLQLDEDDSYETAIAWKDKANELRNLQLIFSIAEDIDSIKAAATPAQTREDLVSHTVYLKERICDPRNKYENGQNCFFRNGISSPLCKQYRTEQTHKNKTVRKDYFIRKRRKRSPISLLAAKGLLAVKFLLTGAKETKANSRRFRSFEKTGDFDTAKEDFFSVFPSNVKYHTGATLPLRKFQGRSYSGTVGDRQIFLKEFGVKEDGYRPTIQVTEPILTPGPYVDKFVYKNKD